MMGGTRSSSEAGVLEGLMTLVSDPTAFAAKIAELKDAQAQIDGAMFILNQQRALIDSNYETLNRKDEELCKLVTEMGEAERDLAKREAAVAKREADVDAKLAKLEAARAERDVKNAATRADIAAERKSLKQVARMNASMENGLNVRAAALDEREAKLAEAEASVAAAAADYATKMGALKSLLA